MTPEMRRRISTRLAWLGVKQNDIATIIGMEQTSLSRALRADRPQKETVLKISHCLGWSTHQFQNTTDRDALTRIHPAFLKGAPAERMGRVEQISHWFEKTWPVVKSETR
jgi:hypothetical protein